jgi:hypothetical protein
MVRKALMPTGIQYMELKGKRKKFASSLSRVSDRSSTLSARPFYTLRLPLR